MASNPRFNQRKRDYVFPDFHKIHLELHSRKGMTIELLWEEYVTDAGEDKCYSYSHFAQLYSDFKNKTRLVLRQMHVAGDKAFVDFAGVSVPYYDRHSGEFKKAQIFVGVLGMSNYTFVKAVPSQKKEDFVRCLREMLEFFNGAPKAIVIDNLKAGVNKADRYDPELNPTLELFAKHYNTVIWPTAPRSPTHKAKAETGVQIVERYILARFRHKNFTGIAEIQREISQLLPSLNLRMMKSYGKSREELYLEYEKQNLMSLPASGFHYTTVQTKRVGHDYHVQYNKVYYSVPFHLAGQFVSLRKGERSIEIFHHNQCVATHAIGLHPWQHQTKEEHRPKEHQWLLVWPAKRLKSWAESIGPATLQMTLNLLMEVQYEELASRKILARLQFANTFGSDALEDCIATFQKKYPQKVQKVSQMKQWLKRNYPVSSTPGYSHRAEPGTQFEREDGLLKNTDNLRGSDYYMEYLKDSPPPLQITVSDSFKEVPNV
ncbi:MAG: IS21 family transposase [Candidatus Cloacimonetes bacterium]|nr:IS21 family transposase [Candidatus Cloacimonadota bacterium]